MLHLFASAGLLPHGYCLLWEPWLVALHAGSDVLIFGSYFVIPVAIVRFLRARPDIRFGGVGVLFASFILLCGLTHLIGLITLWSPIYEAQGVIKLMTGLVSATTAAVLFPLVPKLVALPSPSQLQRANAELRAEVASHCTTLDELNHIRAGLETQIEERTREIKEANERLTVVSRETVHRAKNMLMVIGALASQSAKAANSKEELLGAISGRINSLGNALSVVIDGAKAGAEIADVIGTQLSHYCDSFPGRIAASGPAFYVSAEAAQQISLAIHELATNAVKYGALSGVRPSRWTGSCGGFDRGAGVAVLELDGAEIAQGGM